jgi:hypothetical protein
MIQMVKKNTDCTVWMQHNQFSYSCDGMFQGK